MKIGPKSMNFIRRLNREIFVFQVTLLKFGKLLGAKFQQKISKIMPDRKKHRDMGCEYYYKCSILSYP